MKTNFGVEKDYLVNQYRFGTEQALARAGFLNTNEIVTVQAFVLFLVCVRRHDDSRFVWSLTGLCIRIAQSLGLHRDGTKFSLSPFNTEMRRRLWWQVCILDVRASEDHGSDPSILENQFDTKLPLSVNDADLDPAATEPPIEKEGVSEMTFCLIRYEICHLSRKLSYIPPGQSNCPFEKGASHLTLDEKERMVKASADHLEEKYLKYCEDAGPLYWVAATVARLITAKMSLIIYHPLSQSSDAKALTQTVKDRLFMASIEIIEYTRVLEHEASTKQWGWLFHTYIQWHAIAYILSELATRDHSLIVERAWRAVDSIFNDWGGAIKSTKTGMLWQPMRKLMAKARRKREENMRNQPPTFGLGMDIKDIRPPPRGPTKLNTPGGCNGAIARDRLLAQVTDTTNPGLVMNTNETLLDGFQQLHNADMYMEPQIVGMGPMLAPEQVQLQMQAQQAAQMQQTPWLMDESALLDLDMSDLQEDINWEGWDDLVRDFQLQTDQEMGNGGRGPTLGGMGQWW